MRINPFIVLLAIIFTLSCLIPVNASNEAQTEKHQQLFADVVKDNGTNAELLADKLSIEFDKCPKTFTEELNTQGKETIKLIAELTTYGHYFEDFSGYKERVNELADSTAKTELQNSIDSILGANTQVVNAEDYSATTESFDVETIKHFIDVNLQIGEVNEEFFHTIGWVFRTDPILFAGLMEEYDKDEQEYLAKAVAYDCGKNDYSALTFRRDGIQRTSNKSLDLLIRELGNPENKKLESFFSEENADGTLNGTKSTYTPTIGAILYGSSPIEVGAPVSLTVKYTESAHTSVARSYWTEIYCIRNGNSYLCSSKYVTIPAGSSTVTGTYTLTFTDVGPVYTLVKVYSTQNGTLLESRQGANPDYTKGRWRIQVALPTNRDYKGTLTLYRANGSSVMSCQCLGRSAYNYNMYTQFGHTPTGTYTGVLGGPDGDTNAYGAYKYVAMTGVSGVIISSGRSGIWIHGGRYPYSNTSATWYPLSPTLGCVRIAPTDQQSLQDNITSLTSSTGYHFATGNISIYET